MIPDNHGPKVAEYVREKSAGVQVLLEQYMDFVVNRLFRESLFVHAERAPQISYSPDRSRYQHLHIAAWVPPADEETRLDHTRQEYLESDGARLFTNDPGIKAALDALSGRWPWTQSRNELVEAVRTRLVAAGLNPSGNLDEHIDGLIGTLILQGQARFRLDPVLPEPATTPLRIFEPIRRMAELTRWDSEASIFNIWHETLLLSPIDRHLVPLLDGSRDRDALLEALLAIDGEHEIPIEREDEPVSGDDERLAALTEYVDALPRYLEQMKLLRLG